MEEILSPLHQARAAQRVEVTEQIQPVAASGNRVVRWIRGSRDFLVNVRAEMAKVSWPTRDELVKATRMVVVLSLIIGVALGLLDRLLQLILVDGVAALAR
jgi:preprotein translocase SecE subunit